MMNDGYGRQPFAKGDPVDLCDIASKDIYKSNDIHVIGLITKSDLSENFASNVLY